MTLRSKALILIGVAFLVLVGGIILISQNTLLSEFAGLKQQVKRNVKHQRSPLTIGGKRLILRLFRDITQRIRAEGTIVLG